MSDIHRQDDFLWSGIGLFYALVLWFCASRITGSLLLGQIAVVSLVVVLILQNLQLRKAIANPDEAANLNLFSITDSISGFFNRSEQPTPPPNINQVLDEETTVTETKSPGENLTPEPTPTTITAEEVATVTEVITTETTTPATETTETSQAETAAIPTDWEETEDSTPITATTETPSVSAGSEIETSLIDTAEFEDIDNTPLVAETTAFTQPSTDEITTTSAETSLTQENKDSENSIESNTSYNPSLETYGFEENTESNEIESFGSTQFKNSETLEEILRSQETTEIEEQEQTTTNYEEFSSVEDTDSQKPTDTEITSSETTNRPKSSLDDFLAELENSINKKPKDDN